MKERSNEQAYVSTQQGSQKAHPRLSGTVQNPGWSGDSASQARQRPQAVGSLTYPRERRLTERTDYLVCYDQGRRYFTKHFILFVLPRPDESQPSRLGTGVGKKIGKAVARNRVKRLLKEFFRLNQQSIGPGLDIVIVAKRGIAWKTLHLDLISDEMLPALLRAKSRLPQNRTIPGSTP